MHKLSVIPEKETVGIVVNIAFLAEIMESDVEQDRWNRQTKLVGSMLK